MELILLFNWWEISHRETWNTWFHNSAIVQNMFLLQWCAHLPNIGWTTGRKICSWADTSDHLFFLHANWLGIDLFCPCINNQQQDRKMEKKDNRQIRRTVKNRWRYSNNSAKTNWPYNLMKTTWQQQRRAVDDEDQEGDMGGSLWWVVAPLSSLLQLVGEVVSQRTACATKMSDEICSQATLFGDFASHVFTTWQRHEEKNQHYFSVCPLLFFTLKWWKLWLDDLCFGYISQGCRREVIPTWQCLIFPLRP